MKIPRKKGDTCPICLCRVGPSNPWVKYHVSYRPRIEILACKYCNWVENCMRTGKRIKARHSVRAHKIHYFTKKLMGNTIALYGKI